jgi:hypothetical protein
LRFEVCRTVAVASYSGSGKAQLCLYCTVTKVQLSLGEGGKGGCVVCQVAEGRSVLKSVAAIGGGEGWRDAVYKSRLYYSTFRMVSKYHCIFVSLYLL